MRTLLLALVLFPSPALAQMMCAPLPDLLSGLKRSANEETIFIAKDAQGHEVIITVSPIGGWTMIMQPAPDVGCIVQAGTDFKRDTGI